MTDISLQARINAVRTLCRSLGISAHDLLSESCPPTMQMHSYCSSWTPEEGEEYFFPSDGRVEGDEFWTTRQDDLQRAKAGMCFRTEAACQDAIDASKRLPALCEQAATIYGLNSEEKREMSSLLYALKGGDDHNFQGNGDE